MPSEKRSKKTLIKPIISILVILLTLILFAYYLIHHLDDFKTLKLVNPWFILLLAVFALIGSTLTGMVTDALVAIFGVKLKFKEWFGLSVVTSFYNMITPFRGGMAARAVYLKEKHGFAYTHFIAALAGTYVIDFLVGSFLGLVSLWLLFNQLKIFNWFVLVIFLFFFIPLAIIVLFSPRFPESKNKFINRFINVLNGWNLIRKNKKMILIASIRVIVQIILGTFAGIISYSVFGIQISFAQSLFLTSLGMFGILISITPAGLGIQEAIAIFSALVIGIAPSQSIPVAILSRVISMIVIFTLGPIFSYILFKKSKKLLNQNPSTNLGFEKI